jgi:hypothetical protein
LAEIGEEEYVFVETFQAFGKPHFQKSEAKCKQSEWWVGLSGSKFEQIGFLFRSKSTLR